MGSSANMMRSLLVVLALVAGLIALVPAGRLGPPTSRGRSLSRLVCRERQRHAVLLPGRPAHGVVGHERPVCRVDGLTADLAGGVDHAWGQFVGLRQTVNATPAWVSAGMNQAKVTGTVELSGRTWEVRTDERNQVFLVSASAADRITTVVSGTGGMEDVRFFIDKLTPAKPAS
jgi:hypothetical protein